MVVVPSNHLPGVPPPPGDFPQDLLDLCWGFGSMWWCRGDGYGELVVVGTEVYGALLDMGRRGMQFVLTGSTACPL